MNGNETGLLIALIILLLICFFILGYMYATIRMRRIFNKLVQPPKNIRIKRIDVKDKNAMDESFMKFLSDCLKEIDEEDKKDDDEKGGGK